MAVRMRWGRVLAVWQCLRRSRHRAALLSNAGALHAVRRTCTRGLTAWANRCARNERGKIMRRRGAAAHRANLEATAITAWRALAHRRILLSDASRAASAGLLASRSAAALSRWARTGAKRRGVTSAASRLSAARRRRLSLGAIGLWRSVVLAKVMASGAKRMCASHATQRGIRAWRRHTIRASKVVRAVTRLWRRSGTADALRTAVIRALRSNVKESVAAAATAEQLAASHDMRRLINRAVVGWMAPSRVRSQLHATCDDAMRRLSDRRRIATLRYWQPLSATLKRCRAARAASRAACVSAHFYALRRLCACLRRARSIERSVGRDIERRHLLALAALCARRRAARHAGDALERSLASKERGVLFRGWRRGVALRSVSRALELAWLEGTCVACYTAWRDHTQEARREARLEASRIEKLVATLHNKPARLAATAFRTLTRWRLLLVGRVISHWAAHAKGRASRRHGWLVLSQLTQQGMLRACVSGWREAMWHAQLMRRVHAERRASRESTHLSSVGSPCDSAARESPWSSAPEGSPWVAPSPALHTFSHAAANRQSAVSTPSVDTASVASMMTTPSMASVATTAVVTTATPGPRLTRGKATSRAESLAVLQERIARVKAQVSPPLPL